MFELIRANQIKSGLLIVVLTAVLVILGYVIGEASAASRFLYATGFSGHGFLQGPAVGEVMRDLYLHREPVVDVSSMSAERFTAGDTLYELNIV